MKLDLFWIFRWLSSWMNKSISLLTLDSVVLMTVTLIEWKITLALLLRSSSLFLYFGVRFVVVVSSAVFARIL
jgi:hypothetical protein